MKRTTLVVAASAVLLSLAAPAAALAAINTAPPATTVKLIFIHHSSGEAWLADDWGGLGLELQNNNYFVSDTNYGWGETSPSALPLSRGEPIGSTTDIGDWHTWFSGANAATYMTALYASSGQWCGYTRTLTDPGGANEIVTFKSCFPNSALQGSPSDPVPAIGSNPLRGVDSGSEYHTVANAKGIYIELLNYFGAHPEKLFVVICAPPLRNAYYSANARAFNDWLVNDWLTGYADDNVFVFDYYNVLTTSAGNPSANDLGDTGGNHHRIWYGAIQHKTNGDNDSRPNVLEYWTADDHPSAAGDRKATAEFVPLLNNAYNQWKGNAGSDTTGPDTFAPRRASVRKGRTATLYYRVTDDQSASCVLTIKVKTRAGRTVKTLRVGLKSCDALRHAHFRCNLSRKTYRFFVYAYDMSGNPQGTLGSNRLVVK